MDEKQLKESLVERARSFAARVHKGIVFPNKARSPFITHPEKVAALVKDSGGNDEEIAAAWLHDSVEDTPTTISDIKENFGEAVAEIVDGLTDPPGFEKLPTLVRKTRQAERVRLKSNSVKRVKIADQTSNLGWVAVDPPVTWDKQKCLDYINGAYLIVLGCHGVSDYLEGKFQEAYRAALRVYA